MVIPFNIIIIFYLLGHHGLRFMGQSIPKALLLLLVCIMESLFLGR